MISKDTIYSVRNRSASMVVYKIPEANIRREWQPGEVKRIPFGELEQLSYQAGGRELMANFLQVVEEEVTDRLGINREPEYNMNEQQIIDLILNGSLDAFLDALDFAPIGVIDLIKNFSVSLPITDMNKREALKRKTGFDVDKAIANEKADKANDNVSNPTENLATANSELPHGRRTSGTNYKVVSKEEIK